MTSTYSFGVALRNLSRNHHPNFSIFLNISINKIAAQVKLLNTAASYVIISDSYYKESRCIYELT